MIKTLEFNTYGNEKQKQVCRLWIDDTVTDIVYGGSKGSGKSYLGCSLIFGDALTYPETFYFIARKQLIDLRKYTIPTVYEVLRNWGINSNYHNYKGNDNYFELNNGSRVYLLDARYMPTDPLYQRFGSMQMTRGWIEEAGEFNLEAKSNLQASIGRWKNDTYKLAPKLLQTCNPAKNYLYGDYYKKFKEGNLESWKRFVQALPNDNKKLPDGYLLNLERTFSRTQKERLLLGNWEYDDDPELLVDYDSVCDCFTNNHVSEVGRKCISADLAMKGRDRFVAGSWRGSVCRIATDKTFSPAKEIETDLRKLMDKDGVGRSMTIADSDGLGQYLESYINGIKEFHGGATAFDKDLYANLKSECAYKLAEKINNRDLNIICTEKQREIIKEELMVLKSDNGITDTQKKRIISKEVMKQILGHSPDYLDMLIMGMYFFLAPILKKPKFKTIKLN
ncbi:MAG: terminase family protein [Candidatus Azobacteroides sp.]|nr:terminase family protein [Candidatus Azobacteroides sp.]